MFSNFTIETYNLQQFHCWNKFLTYSKLKSYKCHLSRIADHGDLALVQRLKIVALRFRTFTIFTWQARFNTKKTLTKTRKTCQDAQWYLCVRNRLQPYLTQQPHSKHNAQDRKLSKNRSRRLEWFSRGADPGGANWGDRSPWNLWK